MRRLLFGLLFAALAGPALAQTQPSAYPMATLPLGQVGTDAVLIDQCQQGMLNCVTRQAPSVRIGQPVQQTSAPTTPFAYQQWIDTSQNPPQLKEYIGSTWYKVATLDPSNGYVLSIPSSSITGLGTMATQNASAVAITGGTITGMPVPTSASDVATKSYVDGNAAGLVIETGVKWATAAILPNTPTYNNGAAGVGATLTAGSSTTLTVDGNVVALNDRVLVKNEATQANNGCYSLTTAGGAVPWVLTRCTDFDQPAEVVNNAYFLVSSGSANASSSWVLRISGTPVIGTTVLPFQQFGSSQIYTASTGLSLIGGAFSITNTGVTAATYGDATHVGQFTVNAQGQLTSASSVAMLPTIASINAAAFTTGSVPYISGGAFAQDNTNFFWDGTNHRLGIGTNAPATKLSVGGAGATNWQSYIQGQGTTSGTYGLVVRDSTGASDNFWIRDDGLVGTGNWNFSKAGNETLAGTYLYFSNGTGTVNSTGGPFIYADGNNTAIHLGSGNQNFLFQNSSGTNIAQISSAGVFYLNGVQISAANLSNGTTGSGAVVLAASPVLSGTVSAGNYVIGGQATTDAGTFGFINSNGPAVQTWGTATAGAGKIAFLNAGVEHMTLSNAGNLSVTGQYQVNGSQIAASNLSNGTTGSGSVVLSNTPTFSGIVTTSSGAFVIAGQAGIFSNTGNTINARNNTNGADADFTASRLSAATFATGGAGQTLCFSLGAYTATYYGITSCGSDARLKNYIGPMPGGVSVVDKFIPKEFSWKSDPKNTPDAHFFAQDMLTVAPECVVQNPDGYYSIKDGCVIAYITKAVQEIDARLVAHGM